MGFGTRMTRQVFVQEKMSTGFSEEEANRLYREADMDGDGDVDLQERTWLANDVAATTGAIRELFSSNVGKVDDKGNLVMQEVTDETMNHLVQAFTLWDKDGNGSISHDELARVLSTLNPRMGTTTVEALSKEIDVNEDGRIDITEFMGWLSGEYS